MFFSIKVGNSLRAGLVCSLVAVFLSPCSGEPLSQLPDRVWILRGVHVPLPMVWWSDRLPQWGGREPLWWVTPSRGWGQNPASTAGAWRQIALSRACQSCSKAVLASGLSLKCCRMCVIDRCSVCFQTDWRAEIKCLSQGFELPWLWVSF